MFLRKTISNSALGLLSILIPALSSTGQAAEQQASQAPIASVGPSARSLGVVLLEDKVSEVITTSGQGSVTAQPDAMRAEIGVEVQTRLLSQARKELARKVDNVTTAIRKLGLQNVVLQTSQLDIEPVYDEAAPGKPANIVGYRARNTIIVTLRKVSPDKLGSEAAKVVDASVLAGANIVEGISFFLSSPGKAQAKALRLAVTDAKRNAKIIAASAGVDIVAVHEINGVPERVNPVYLSRAFAMHAATPIEPGELTITATVTARYHFARR